MLQQPPDLATVQKLMQDITNIGQFDRTFTVPGREKSHEIKIGTLWEEDLLRVKKRAANETLDRGVQYEIVIFETLVEAIMQIDDYAFCSGTPEIHDLKKGQLREILKKVSPFMITALYTKYVELTTEGSTEVEERIEEIKKSSGPSKKEEQTPPPPTLD